ARDAALGNDPNQANVAGAMDVGAAAQLGGDLAKFDHAHLFAVGVAKEGQGALGDRIIKAGLEGNALDVLPDVQVDPALDLGELVSAEALRVVEVKAQTLGVDQGAGLLDVLAEDLAQDRVQDVGRRVVVHRVATGALVDAEADLITDSDRAAHNFAAVNAEAADQLLAVD